MIPLFNKIHNLGTQELKIDYKIPTVKISNVIAFIFLMTGVIYGAISAYLAPQLIDICIVALLFCMYLLQAKNLNSEKNIKKLLHDIQGRNTGYPGRN